MRSYCILDSIKKLKFVTVFAGNVQKSPIASHLKSLDFYFELCEAHQLSFVYA